MLSLFFVGVICIWFAMKFSFSVTGTSIIDSLGRLFVHQNQKQYIIDNDHVLSRPCAKGPKELEMQYYKRLYHSLHNLEDHTETLSEARDTLVSLLAESIADAKLRDDGGILKLGRFDTPSLICFMAQQEKRISQMLEQYINRRKMGGAAELFQTVDSAQQWLIQRGPSKLVDGAWLGHIHKATTPFALRPITKTAWQILSEELGDGDLSKNHAAVYRNLLRKIRQKPPAAQEGDPSYDEFDSDEGSLEICKGAVAQLLISLFPEEFLPEILGFNMHFECLTWDTVRAAHELKEQRLDNYYFLLHISIDNSHSGHTAMATQVVIDYLDHVRSEEGEDAMEKAWKGVQAGYLLSEHFAVTRDENSHTTEAKQAPTAHHLDGELMKIFQGKLAAAGKLHCISKVRIQSKTLDQWLNPEALATTGGQEAFLDGLRRAKPWVHNGDSKSSRLIQALEWNGKMFGAFTKKELGLFKRWIDEAPMVSLADSSAYWKFVGREELPSAEVLKKQDIRSGNMVYSSRGLSSPWKAILAEDCGVADATTTLEDLLLTSKIDVEALVPLWFAHPALLESLISVPIKTCDVETCAVVRVLRAQKAFDVETEGVAGTDEMRREDRSLGLVELGLEIIERASLPLPRPETLRDVVPEQATFAIDMLHWSIRPMQHRDALLGMAWTFVELHEAVACKGCNLLSDTSRRTLGEIARREREALGLCRDSLSGDEERKRSFEAAALYSRRQIIACLGYAS